MPRRRAAELAGPQTVTHLRRSLMRSAKPCYALLRQTLKSQAKRLYQSHALWQLCTRFMELQTPQQVCDLPMPLTPTVIMQLVINGQNIQKTIPCNLDVLD